MRSNSTSPVMSSVWLGEFFRMWLLYIARIKHRAARSCNSSGCSGLGHDLVVIYRADYFFLSTEMSSKVIPIPRGTNIVISKAGMLLPTQISVLLIVCGTQRACEIGGVSSGTVSAVDADTNKPSISRALFGDFFCIWLSYQKILEKSVSNAHF